MPTSTNSLGEILHAWRDRISPADVGLSGLGRRRAHGLRREELAGLARVSVDYLIRLEQGRSKSPSVQVIDSLARALQLSAAERDHLYTLSGLAPPSAGTIDTHVPPGVQRLISRLGEVPLALFSADWTLITWSPLWAALLGDPLRLPIENRNLIDYVFLSGDGAEPSWPVHSERGAAEVEAALVSDLRIAAANYPDDARLGSRIERARASSPRFAELWDSGVLRSHVSDRKTILNDLVGTLTLDCDILAVPGADLKLVVYTAATGSEEAEKLDLLRISGINTFAVTHGTTEM